MYELHAAYVYYSIPYIRDSNYLNQSHIASCFVHVRCVEVKSLWQL